METNIDESNVQFFWGKLYFRLTFEAFENPKAKKQHHKIYICKGKQYRVSRLELMHHNKWHIYLKPTSHGLIPEETYWEHQGKKHHVELPKNLFSVSQGFCAEELGFKPLVSQTA